MKTNISKTDISDILIKKNNIGNRKYKDYAWGYLMVAPTIIGLIILNIWPIFYTLNLSFHKNGDFGGAGKFAGLLNYKQLLSDVSVAHASLNTFAYALVSVPVGILLSLIAAVLLNTNIKGKSIYRTIYFLPMVSAPAAIAMVWKWLYSTDYGLINYMLSLIGIENGPNWITNPKTALISIIIIGIWSGLGYNMIILLAGLQGIPKTLFEAADIDGAGPIRKFFSITVPLISPTMFFVVITSIIGSLQVFDYIFMIWGTGTIGIEYTQSLVFLFYKNSFLLNDKGYGSAIAMLLLVIIFIITAIQLKLQKKWVHYQ
ncbi:carbohydrate ABC transporter permease [Clostridium lacusfryxellense]|uniref:carbohydrate ABC transporter permease n=1 Tax=Clostridium lacusfryxellense TaxID=205328 RepID=UPI001C0D6D79|nr:sugar ABC transporter permease [Clostridium lacusfryxellense]MBU3113303.1 sugar ABC transporter permease [Clostridium lacusfryxellense]